MTENVTDIETFKHFIRRRTLETWEQRRTPYYLSFVATDLKKSGFDYRELVAPLKLSQWAGSNEVADVTLVSHPTQLARIGFVPTESGFKFDAEEQPKDMISRSESHTRQSRSLVQFVQSLSNLPDSAVENFSVPARVLIALLQH